jgi:hypothetical protein
MPTSQEILKSINVTKDSDLIDSSNESDYVPFFINRALSFYPDTILHANNMNRYSNLNKTDQYKYYVYGTAKRNRYTPWAKFNPSKKLELIKKYSGLSYTRAKEILPLINDSLLLEIEKEMEKRNAE